MSKGKIMEQGRHEELVSRNGIYATLVKAQDLAPANIEKNHGSGGTSTSDEVSEKGDDHVDRVQSLARIRTAEAQQLAALKDREDHDLYEKTGITRSIWKLLRGTPDIWLWFAVTIATCIGGGEWSRLRKAPQLQPWRVWHCRYTCSPQCHSQPPSTLGKPSC